MCYVPRTVGGAHLQTVMDEGSLKPLLSCFCFILKHALNLCHVLCFKQLMIFYFEKKKEKKTVRACFNDFLFISFVLNKSG